MAQSQQLLDKHDVARILKISPRSVDWLLATGKLKSRKVGVLNRWLLSDLEKFLKVPPGSLRAEALADDIPGKGKGGGA